MSTLNELYQKLSKQESWEQRLRACTQQLEDQGIEDIVVAMPFNPSWEFFVAFLALLKCGNQVVLFSGDVDVHAYEQYQVCVQGNDGPVVTRNETVVNPVNLPKDCLFAYTESLTGTIIHEVSKTEFEENIRYILRILQQEGGECVALSVQMETADQITAVAAAIISELPIKLINKEGSLDAEGASLFLPYSQLIQENLKAVQVILTEPIPAEPDKKWNQKTPVLLYRTGGIKGRYVDYQAVEQGKLQLQMQEIQTKHVNVDLTYFEAAAPADSEQNQTENKGRFRDVFAKSGNSYKLIKRNTNYGVYSGFFIDFQRLDGIFKTHPSIDEAVVSLSSEKKDTLYVFYTVSNHPQTPEELANSFQNQFPKFHLQFIKLTKLPFTVFGEIDRNKLEVILSADKKDSAVPGEAGGEYQERVYEVISAFLNGLNSNIENYTIDTEASYEDLGLNSLSFIDLVVTLEEAFGFEYPDEMLDIELFSSLGKFIVYVSGIVEKKGL